MYILFFILGLVFGSFSSVIIYRNPSGRSQCPACKKTLTIPELIPVVSYAVQCGRCRSCKERIGWIYPALELGSAVLFLYAFSITATALSAILLALALWLLLTISIIDIRTHSISDAHSAALLIAGIGYSQAVGIFAVSGVALGAGFFFTLWAVSRGKWIGSGDILLAAGIGALLGSWQNMIACLMITYIVGATIACTLLLTHRVKRGDYVAFAPFLALGTLLTIIFRERINLIIEFYL